MLSISGEGPNRSLSARLFSIVYTDSGSAQVQSGTRLSEPVLCFAARASHLSSKTSQHFRPDSSILSGTLQTPRWLWPSRGCRIEQADKTSRSHMKILLYNPDNGVTGNFMPASKLKRSIALCYNA